MGTRGKVNRSNERVCVGGLTLGPGVVLQGVQHLVGAVVADARVERQVYRPESPGALLRVRGPATEAVLPSLGLSPHPAVLRADKWPCRDAKTKDHAVYEPRAGPSTPSKHGVGRGMGGEGVRRVARGRRGTC